jgi:hypothetical protein
MRRQLRPVAGGEETGGRWPGDGEAHGHPPRCHNLAAAMNTSGFTWHSWLGSLTMADHDAPQARHGGPSLRAQKSALGARSLFAYS